jgi:diaminohydroxyphosphoribosylaminopyrimidine deaminase/5-amino-6-(5-phosphoribosylamino)uracil reductase
MATTDEAFMAEAIELSCSVRRTTSPNPWVGCVVVSDRGEVVGRGATEPPGGRHAEIVALDEAGPLARGAAAYVTLEPCCHHGRTPPCTGRLIEAGVARVVLGALDPDPNVSGAGVAALRAAGLRTTLGVLEERVAEVLQPYLVHRRSGRPYVVLKLAATLDGRIAAADGTSRFITGPAARADVHELRAESDAVLVGAGTVRSDNPELTVRPAEATTAPPSRQPLRVVLGRAPARARVQPALELAGDLRGVLDELGRMGVLQLLVEGGAAVAGEFHRLGLVNRYVVYVAPAVLGSAGVPMFAWSGAPTMGEIWRGRLVGVRRLGDDVRLDVEPAESLRQ